MKLRKVIYAAMCLALAFLLPYLTGQLRELGKALCPMHLPVFICSYACGPVYAGIVGFIAPLIRSLITGMPVFPTKAIPMMFELMTYGAVAGVCYKLFPKKIPYVYISLVVGIISGRLVLSAVNLVMNAMNGVEFSFFTYFVKNILEAVPGLILQIVIVPLVAITLRKTKLIED